MRPAERIIIRNGTIVTSTGEIPGRTVVIENGKISGFMVERDMAEANCPVIDAEGLHITPGLIDTHVVGALGKDCRQGPEAVQAIAQALAQNGVTSWLPTLYSVVPKNLSKSVSDIVATRKEKQCSNILGVHLEGPYFAPARRGIARSEDLATPDFGLNQTLLDEHADAISLVTLSPDLDGVLPLIAQFVKARTVVAAGHTAASKVQISQAREAGLSHITHIFNAMDDRGWVQPGVIKPGTSDFCLLENSLSASIIGDGVHVLPEIVRLVLRVKGVGRTIAITDLWPGAGLEQGTAVTYVTGEEAYVAEDAMRLTSDNQLAGGTTFLNGCIYNIMKAVGLSWADAVRIGCLNPARLLGIDHQKGDIKPGMDADIIVVSDRWEPQLVVIEGNIVRNGMTR